MKITAKDRFGKTVHFESREELLSKVEHVAERRNMAISYNKLQKMNIDALLNVIDMTRKTSR